MRRFDQRRLERVQELLTEDVEAGRLMGAAVQSPAEARKTLGLS